MPSVVRAFVAIELPIEALAALARIQDRLRRSDGGTAGRWVRREAIHLTLKFLGDVAEDSLPTVFDAVDRACATRSRFEIVLERLGCFPSARRPRVVWVGLRSEDGALAALQKAVEEGLTSLGFPRERRAFTPHLTLGRVRHGATRADVEALGRTLATTQVGRLATMRVSSVHVIRSVLRPEGAIYSDLSTSSLPS